MNINLKRQKKYENIVTSDTPDVCPRCGSSDVAWCGGDMDGHGGYYHMYVCNDCGPDNAVEVFLVPCCKEEYGHGPGEIDLSEVQSTAYGAEA